MARGLPMKRLPVAARLASEEVGWRCRSRPDAAGKSRRHALGSVTRPGQPLSADPRRQHPDKVESWCAGWASPEGRKVSVVVVDGSGGHTAEGLKVPPNVALHRRPSCTPELQPAEHLWPVVCEDLADRAFDTL